jgi:hypothetical protein
MNPRQNEFFRAGVRTGLMLKANTGLMEKLEDHCLR